MDYLSQADITVCFSCQHSEVLTPPARRGPGWWGSSVLSALLCGRPVRERLVNVLSCEYTGTPLASPSAAVMKDTFPGSFVI